MEVNNIKKLFSNSTFVFFNWCITDTCNFKCSYCCTHNTNKWTCTEFDEILNILKTVKKQFRICLTGGETTEHPHLQYILRELSKIEYLDRVFVFTNLSKSLKYYASLELSEKITITASYHFEYHNSAFLKKCIELQKIRGHNFTVNISISDKKEHIEKTIEVFEVCVNNNIDYNINFLHNTRKKYLFYRDSIYEVYKKYYSFTDMYDEICVELENGDKETCSNDYFRKSKINTFKGYMCNAQLYSIERNNDIINVCTREKLIFPFDNNTFNKFVQCSLDTCDSDIKITYTKIKKKFYECIN